MRYAALGLSSCDLLEQTGSRVHMLWPTKAKKARHGNSSEQLEFWREAKEKPDI